MRKKKKKEGVRGRRVVVTDHGAFVLLNVYVPNAGDRKRAGGERVDFKCRFLRALKEKADSFVASGKEVGMPYHTGSEPCKAENLL
jgi:exonuclease III